MKKKKTTISKKNISKTTMSILVITTILFSILGTWFFLNTFDKITNVVRNIGFGENQNNNQANVKVNINSPPKYDKDGGEVRLDIVNPN